MKKCTVRVEGPQSEIAMLHEALRSQTIEQADIPVKDGELTVQSVANSPKSPFQGGRQGIEPEQYFYIVLVAHTLAGLTHDATKATAKWVIEAAKARKLNGVRVSEESTEADASEESADAGAENQD